MQILQTCFRVYADADQLEPTIRFYEGLQSMACERRVAIAETSVIAAKIGAFLILAGDAASLTALRHVAAIFYVDALGDYHTWLGAAGAELLDGPRTVTSGRNLTARHPDGLVVEYFEDARR